MTMTGSAAPFIATVGAECALLKRFIDLLERERQLLLAGSVDDLPKLVEEKNGLARQLADLGRRRVHLLAAAGWQGEGAELDDWLRSPAAEPSALTLWSTLRQLAGQARDLNSANGELIRLRLQHNSLALDTLLGPTGSAKLYGPDGQSRQHGAGRISFSV
ncbi:MAG TPA: flagellar protein FlgN [Accumulibacter sp.]|nr:flagellar protein FlgN [Accumulibacter sp.]HMY05978.1 flagellar protein FlgN [Accumulibacter sp.]HNL13085.1 flagellar protein FlgN [Accumulibacter sp.]HNO56683.1 flagellar protein FlgN [Accumulibacter sp.]